MQGSRARSDRTGHPNLPDWTISGLNPDLYFKTFYLPSSDYQRSDPLTQIWCQKFLDQINKQKKSWKKDWKKKLKKNVEENFWMFLFSNVFKVQQRPGWKMSGFWTVRILKICWTSGPDVMFGRALIRIALDNNL